MPREPETVPGIRAEMAIQSLENARRHAWTILERAMHQWQHAMPAGALDEGIPVERLPEERLQPGSPTETGSRAGAVEKELDLRDRLPRVSAGNCETLRHANNVSRALSTVRVGRPRVRRAYLLVRVPASRVSCHWVLVGVGTKRRRAHRTSSQNNSKKIRRRSTGIRHALSQCDIDLQG